MPYKNQKLQRKAEQRYYHNKKDKKRKPCPNCGKDIFFGTLCMKCTKTGENNPFWKGGALRVKKRQATIRDDYTCQICGLRDVEIMEVDHILPRSVRPDLNLVLENLMTLCPNCHRRKTNRELKSSFYYADNITTPIPAESLPVTPA